MESLSGAPFGPDARRVSATAAPGKGPRSAEEAGAPFGPDARRVSATAAPGKGPRSAEEAGAPFGPGARRVSERVPQRPIFFEKASC